MIGVDWRFLTVEERRFLLMLLIAERLTVADYARACGGRRRLWYAGWVTDYDLADRGSMVRLTAEAKERFARGQCPPPEEK